jgi:hypothetical protein
MLFPDGAVGSGWQGDMVIVAELAGGSRLAVDAWQYRPEGQVTGWQSRCDCGWRGRVWERVAGESGTDLAALRVASVDSFLPEAVEDGPFFDEWAGHVEPVDAVARLVVLQQEVQAATARLDEGVGFARLTGASWADIGRAVGMSRQSAHERWAHRLIGDR